MLFRRRFQAHKHLVYWFGAAGRGALVLPAGGSLLGANVMQIAKILFEKRDLSNRFLFGNIILQLKGL